MDEKTLYDIMCKEGDRAVRLSHGFICVMLRRQVSNWYGGRWCGYVATPIQLTSEQIDNLSVHWWITRKSYKKDEQLYWYWFDCWHAWDLHIWLPTFAGLWYVYRDKQYVKDQTDKLAEQIKNLTN